MTYRVLSLFAGIGGFDLGLERTGEFRTVGLCEINPRSRQVLRKHWPEVPIYEDVCKLTGDTLRSDGVSVDVICGGFPCQDISTVGTGHGLDGVRSGLWFHFARLIRELRPAYVIVENVAALRSSGLDRVLGSLAAIRYDATWDCIPAAYVGAGHPRDRIWIVAHRACLGWREINIDVDPPTPPPPGQPAGTSPKVGGQWEPEPAVGRVVHGLPGRVDRIEQLGNAVVPQLVERIGNAIIAAERAVSFSIGDAA